MWILWLQLTITYACSPGMSCPQPSTQTQQVSSHQTQTSCEDAKKVQQSAWGTQGVTEVSGLRVTSTAKVWCATQ
jgi:hypothetical protein